MSESPTTLHWLLDTRPLWPVDTTKHPKEQMLEFKEAAKDDLALVPLADQQSVLKYYHIADARMSLASQLLKRLAIVKLCGVPWTEAFLSRAENHKPCYRSPTNGVKMLDFNVSHQDGIVTLLASNAPGVSVGIDVVSVDQRRQADLGIIDTEGFASWVDMYAPVFAPSETLYLKTFPDNLGLDPNVDISGGGRDALARCNSRERKLIWKTDAGTTQELEAATVIDAKIRRFYALWALREAYVKMTGDALLADWLQRLEFVNVRAAMPAADAAAEDLEKQGELISKIQLKRDGREVEGVHVELRALGRNHMVASAVSLQDGSMHPLLPPIQHLQLARDVLPFTPREKHE